jgi:protein-L-isoaspartate(D-aspartate) O-methyltransferase
MNKKDLIKNLKLQGYSKKIIDSFKKVKREDFAPEQFKHIAYEDKPIPISPTSTISQPSTVAFMINLLELKEKNKVLEVGSGSGYALALMSNIVKKGELYGVEIYKQLADISLRHLKDYDNVWVFNKDGKYGLPEKAPFDRILVSATTTTIPINLIDQLKNNGILVAPIADSIIRFKKVNKHLEKSIFPGYRFVELK